MNDTLEIAIEAVKKGGEKALFYFGNNPKVTIKPDHSPVTIADKETEEVIKSFILSKDAYATFLGEESGGDFETNEAWIIDPIDGTKNFMRGLDQWGILLAHYKNGACDLGVSYIPTLNQICYASRGTGAFVNDKQVYVSKIANLSDAYFSHGELRYFESIPNLETLSKAVLTERGATDATAYNNLALGNIDIAMDAYCHAWDNAPATVFIEEAGGKVSQMDGKPWNIKSTNFVATNGILHEKVIEILNATK